MNMIKKSKQTVLDPPKKHHVGSISHAPYLLSKVVSLLFHLNSNYEFPHQRTVPVM